jgi:hypothetical protein
LRRVSLLEIDLRRKKSKRKEMSTIHRYSRRVKALRLIGAGALGLQLIASTAVAFADDGDHDTWYVEQTTDQGNPEPPRPVTATEVLARDELAARVIRDDYASQYASGFDQFGDDSTVYFLHAPPPLGEGAVTTPMPKIEVCQVDLVQVDGSGASYSETNGLCK